MVKFLKEKGHYVRTCGKAFGNDRSLNFGLADEIIPCDLRVLDQVLKATEGMDYVIHLASDMGGVGYFSANDYVPFFNNMTMDMNVLKACEYHKDIKRLYYSSSACIYPTHLQMNWRSPAILSEDMIFPAQSDQMYGWEKLMMTMLCERATFDARVGIQHTVYGPYQETQGERMKFPTAIATKALAIKRNFGPLEIWGDGMQRRTFLYIDDAVEKIYKVLMSSKYSGPVNIGSSRLVSVDEVAHICCNILKIDPPFVHTMDKPSGVLGRGCDNTKFEKEYGYEDQVSLEDGFGRLIEWIQAQ